MQRIIRTLIPSFRRPSSGTGLPPRLGRVAAGFPLEAIEDSEQEELLDLLGAAGRYALRVGDDSMQATGIFDGDIVIVQSAQRIRNGDVAVVLLDGQELLLKRVRYLDGGRIRLYSDDPLAGDGDIAAERVRIQGKVVGQLRRYP